jgi:hypothetical protein
VGCWLWSECRYRCVKDGGGGGVVLVVVRGEHSVDHAPRPPPPRCGVWSECHIVSTMPPAPPCLLWWPQGGEGHAGAGCGGPLLPLHHAGGVCFHAQV